MTRKAVAGIVLAVVAGCATQADREAAAAQAQADWKECVDTHLAIGWLATRAGVSGMGETTGKLIAEECGTGGLSAAYRSAYMLTVVKALEESAESAPDKD